MSDCVSITIFLIYSRLLVIGWQSSVSPDLNHRSQRFTPPRMMCVVFISVIFGSSTVDSGPGRNWRFWSNPILVVPYAQIITGTIFVLTFQILLTSFSRSLYLLSFSVSFVLMFQPSVMAISMIRQVSSCLSFTNIPGRFVSIFPSVVTGRAHIMVVKLTIIFVIITIIK